jgi:uncharacterized repeat protein (TIGR03803 family)
MFGRLCRSALLTLCAQSPVIYNFTGSNSGRLFGTTVYGGASGDGTAYKLTPGGGGSWTETLLHSFAGHPGDGAEPDGDLLMVSSNLYGTTAIGGSSNAGTVY